jgi:hypothetical protein
VPAPVEGISIREFARRAGCDDSIVRRKVKSGHLPALANGKLDPAHLDVDWRGGVPAHDAVAGTAGILQDGETPEEAADRIVNVEGRALWSKAEAERVKENYAAKLRQLEYDRESGLVAEVDDVVMAVASELSLVRNKLLNIGSRVAPRVAVMRSAEEIKAMIDAEVVLALEELTLDGPRATDFGEVRAAVQQRFGIAS